MPQLNQIVQFQMTGNGPMMVSSSAINPADGSGVAPDGSPNFAGQVFSNPTAGNLGVLQRRLFSGPWTFDIDLALIKNIAVTDRQSIEIRVDAYQRAEPSHLLGGRPEHQFHHLRRHQLDVLFPAHPAIRTALPVLTLTNSTQRRGGTRWSKLPACHAGIRAGIPGVRKVLHSADAAG